MKVANAAFPLQITYSYSQGSVRSLGSLLAQEADATQGDDVLARFDGRIARARRAGAGTTSLDLTRCGLGEEECAAADDDPFRLTGCQQVASTLRAPSSIRSLSLASNSINAEGAAVIAEALSGNTTLTFLNLAKNTLGDLGAAHVAKALEQNKAVTWLSLSKNGIGARGAEHVANMLYHNSYVTSLNMSRNGAGARGAQWLAGALRTNGSLTAFDLSANAIGPQGAEKFVDALQYNLSITSLVVERNYINSQDIERNIEAALRKNRAGVRAVTVVAVRGGGGPETVTFSCTGLCGSEVARLDLPPQERLAALTAGIAAQVAPGFAGHWRLMLPNGTLLQDPSGSCCLRDLFGDACESPQDVATCDSMDSPTGPPFAAVLDSSDLRLQARLGVHDVFRVSL